MRTHTTVFFILATMAAAPAYASGAQDCESVVEVLSIDDAAPKQTFSARVLLSKKTGGHSADCSSLIGEHKITLEAPVDDLAKGQRLSVNAHIWSDAMAGGGTTWKPLPDSSAMELVDAAAAWTVQCKVSVRAVKLTVANGKTDLKGEVKAAEPPCEWLVGTTHAIVPEGEFDPNKGPLEFYLNARHKPASGLEMKWFTTPQEIEPPPEPKPEAEAEAAPAAEVASEAKPSSGCSVAGGELGLLAWLAILPLFRRRRGFACDRPSA